MRVWIISRTSRGLEMWAFMPASRSACTSSLKALAVMAMTGMEARAGSGRARMARVAS